MGTQHQRQAPEQLASLLWLTCCELNMIKKLSINNSGVRCQHGPIYDVLNSTYMTNIDQTGGRFMKKCWLSLTSIGNRPIIKIRLSYDSLIFIMETPIHRKTIFTLRWGPLLADSTQRCQLISMGIPFSYSLQSPSDELLWIEWIGNLFLWE